MNEVTKIIERIRGGDVRATDDLLPIVYKELRRLAGRKLAAEPGHPTIQTTELVHEAYLRLVGADQSWDCRAHFLAAAAEAMRRILIDRARHRKAIRHGGGQQRVDLEQVELPFGGDDDQLLAVNEALQQLAAAHPTEAEVVKLRYFVGLTHDEIADALGISVRTVKYYWAHARAWLFQEITGAEAAE